MLGWPDATQATRPGSATVSEGGANTLSPPSNPQVIHRLTDSTRHNHHRDLRCCVPLTHTLYPHRHRIATLSQPFGQQQSEDFHSLTPDSPLAGDQPRTDLAGAPATRSTVRTETHSPWFGRPPNQIPLRMTQRGDRPPSDGLASNIGLYSPGRRGVGWRLLRSHASVSDGLTRTPLT